MKDKVLTIMIALAFFAGLSLLLYPTVSNYYNATLQSKIVADYTQKVNTLEIEKCQALRQDAVAYNQKLLERTNAFQLSDPLHAEYETLLNTSGNGVMGYVEIPSIDCTLPICHGTDRDVLQDAVGHLEWSSLPVGGESTHAVLSAHRGLPSAELFTNIDHLELGDVFYITVLNETLAYRVDHIAVVEPNDYAFLGVSQGEDYVTLMTCTPYGINSHRLLVRGVRVHAVDSTADAASLPIVNNEITNVPLKMLVPIILAVFVVVFFVLLLFDSKKGGKRSNGNVLRKK